MFLLGVEYGTTRLNFEEKYGTKLRPAFEETTLQYGNIFSVSYRTTLQYYYVTLRKYFFCIVPYHTLLGGLV